jgi:hypothetical protein
MILRIIGVRPPWIPLAIRLAHNAYPQGDDQVLGIPIVRDENVPRGEAWLVYRHPLTNTNNHKGKNR